MPDAALPEPTGTGSCGIPVGSTQPLHTCVVSPSTGGLGITVARSTSTRKEVLTMNAKSLLRLVIACGLAIATVRVAGAQSTECGAGCGMQKVACLKAARGTKVACGLTCRQSSDPTAVGGCMRDCAATFRGSKGTCKSHHSSCIDA